MDFMENINIVKIPNTVLDENQFNCKLCNVNCLNEQEWKMHKKGSQHQSYFLEKKNKKPIYFHCKVCNKSLSNKGFYDVHMGSKTHRRNLKKSGLCQDNFKTPQLNQPMGRSLIPSKGTKCAFRASLPDLPDERLEQSKDLVINPQGEYISHDFIRKKYRTRPSQTDEIYSTPYICSLTSFLSVRLALDQNVQDFQISVNDKEWGTFGDIVVSVLYKQKTTVYAIKCNQSSSWFRQIDTLNDAKVEIEKHYNQIINLNYDKDCQQVKFLIFTPHSTSSSFVKTTTISSKVLNKFKTKNCQEDFLDRETLFIQPLRKREEIINTTGDLENVYSFSLSNNNDVLLPKLYLYTNQKLINANLDQILKKKFDHCSDIGNKFTRFVLNWKDGKLGGHYKLNKKHVVLKIGEILLGDFVVSPQQIQTKPRNFKTWNKLMDKVDVIMVKEEPNIISKICQPLNNIIEKKLSLKIDTLTKTVNLWNGGKLISNDNEDHELKAYLFESTKIQGDIPLISIYKAFWQAGKIPLLISTEGKEYSKEFITNVASFMKKNGVNKKFLIKTNEPFFRNSSKSLKIFSCLDDVKDFVVLNELKLKVTSTYSLSLATIIKTDNFILKWMTANMVFDMCLDNYSIKAKDYGQCELKIVLSDEEKDKLKTELYEVDKKYRAKIFDNKVKIKGIDPALF